MPEAAASDLNSPDSSDQRGDPAASGAGSPSAGSPGAGSPGGGSSAGVSLLRSEELLKGEREILIAHCQDVYRLRVTRNGKLILTK
jgi:hypothetical protein